MTEFWVSKARYWCKYCKCWMSDTKAARFKHEQGERHKSAVLAWMKENRQKKKDEAREKEELAREMAMIDKAARGQFSQDVAQGLASYNRPAGAGGSWYGFAPGHSGAPAGSSRLSPLSSSSAAPRTRTRRLPRRPNYFWPVCTLKYE